MDQEHTVQLQEQYMPEEAVGEDMHVLQEVVDPEAAEPEQQERLRLMEQPVRQILEAVGEVAMAAQVKGTEEKVDLVLLLFAISIIIKAC